MIHERYDGGEREDSESGITEDEVASEDGREEKREEDSRSQLVR